MKVEITCRESILLGQYLSFQCDRGEVFDQLPVLIFHEGQWFGKGCYDSEDCRAHYLKSMVAVVVAEFGVLEEKQHESSSG